jgi:hypothetical protein
MIINLNKFQSVKNFTVDFTKNKPGIYFLLNIDDKTPRYKRIKNNYIQDPKGSYVIDHGMDITERVTRILTYVGESIYPLRRLASHYFEENTDLRKGKDKRGIGPVFTHIRIIDKFKSFEYDSIRLHYERILVRKYLPHLNLASQLTENQKLIILNSAGKVSPYDLIKPYLLHSRDIYKAFKAWGIEDMNYIEKEFASFSLKNKTGLIHPNTRDSRLYSDKRGNKLAFSRWVGDCVLRFHKKQVAAIKTYGINYKHFIKTYDPDRYQEILKRDRITAVKCYKKNREYKLKSAKIYYKLRTKTNQPELI